MTLIRALFILLIISNTSLLYAQTGETTISKSDNRFIGNLKSNNVIDHAGLMDRFQLHLQWWTLLAEPIEYYDFTWYSTNQFTIEFNGKTRVMTRATLSKYPDLLKRFERIRPIRIRIEVSGEANGGILDVKRGRTPSTYGLQTRARSNFKKEGQSFDRYQLFGEVIYEIPNSCLVPSVAGDKGLGLVPGSQHWNEFLFWNESSSTRLATYQKGDKNDQALFKNNKNRFGRTTSFTLSARVLNVEWPAAEMESIIRQYDRYKNGLDSPSKKVKEANDLNDLLSDMSDPPVTDYQIQTRDNKQGVVAQDGRILIPFKDWSISNYDIKTGLANVQNQIDTEVIDGCDENFEFNIYEVQTVNGKGESVIPAKTYASRSVNFDFEALTLVKDTFGETEQERSARIKREKEAARRREARKKQCEIENNRILNNYKQQLRSRGIEVR